jgi:hypothetical protein
MLDTSVTNSEPSNEILFFINLNVLGKTISKPYRIGQARKL